jgi:ABC-type transporter Mla subunit MlaD
MRLDRGSDTSLSVQQFLATRVYPVLERFAALTKDMDTLQNAAGSQLDGLEAAAASLDRLGRGLSSRSDTLVARAERTLDRLARLTAQSTVVLHGLEEVAVACQDTTHGPGRLVANRDLYDKTMAVTHALEDMLKLLEKDGLTDAIHFWRNVRVRWKKPPE